MLTRWNRIGQTARILTESIIRIPWVSWPAMGLHHDTRQREYVAINYGIRA